MKKNILVIGLGSMGQRRIRILKALYPEYDIIGIDQNRERAKTVEELYMIQVHRDMSEIEVPIEASFICTSPESHYKLIHSCLEYGSHVFSEINLMDIGYEENIKLAKTNDKILFLSSTPLYKEEIQYISEKVKHDKNKKVYIYHVGQYLKDWHPWDNLEDFFVSKKDTNGCRELMAIELPWILSVFGEVEEVSVTKSHVTQLDINFPDTYIVQLTHKDKTVGTIIFDVVSRKAVRKLEVYNETMYIAWNGTPDSLMEKNIITGEEQNIIFHNYIHDERYGAFINEAAYMKEVEEFFEVIDGKAPLYDFEKDLKILNLINKVEG